MNCPINHRIEVKKRDGVNLDILCVPVISPRLSQRPLCIEDFTTASYRPHSNVYQPRPFIKISRNTGKLDNANTLFQNFD